jgi:hypothetical protein
MPKGKTLPLLSTSTAIHLEIEKVLERINQGQSESYLTTDDQSARLSCYQATF